MIVSISKSKAKGIVNVPPSKSVSHRLLISAALCRFESTIRNLSFCDDVNATIQCLKALNVSFVTDFDTNTVKIKGVDIEKATQNTVLLCNESASTLRFMIPLCLLCRDKIILSGKESLMKRPLSVYERLSENNGFTFEKDGNSIAVKGPLKSGIFYVEGDISSQFISGLMFALPLCKGDSTINIIGNFESKPYVLLTQQILSEFGIEIIFKDEKTIFIKGEQSYKPVETNVEGDYSAGAYFQALKLLDNDIEIAGLPENSLQGDKICEKYLNELSKGFSEIDVRDCIDSAPLLFAFASAKYGGEFHGINRLRIKESDRIASMVSELEKFGAECILSSEKLIIKNKGFHKPEKIIYGHNDHRIVMALSILLTLTGGKISDAQAVKKSYPSFFEDLAKLRVEIKAEKE